MTEHGTTLEQQAFVAELDDVADVLKAAGHGHAEHRGWSLGSTRVLRCGCGEALYRPDPAVPG